MMEFHVSRKARDHYQFSGSLFSFTGNVIFANLAAGREFAHRMNQARGAATRPEKAIHPGALYAMGLIDELSHALVAFYRTQLDPRAMVDALAWFEARVGRPALQKTLTAFVQSFPGSAVYAKKISPEKWLAGTTDGISNRAIAFEEMMLLWLANLNPAFNVFIELFDDTDLAAASSYRAISGDLQKFFSTRPAIGPDNLNLIDMLRAPALAAPDSLSGQLAFIREKWRSVLGGLLDRIMLALDVLQEEEVAIWLRFHPPAGGAQGRRGANGAASSVPSYADAALEYERFSQDREWMPTTVLMAKSTYVWLEQLSRKHRRDIHRLDQIPNEELELLARRGMNALWLIGIWERSRASQTIKRLCGNQDAVASAYSLDGYSIAADLGGEGAYVDLRDRAAAHGIRLASDMVPNHMGIDSSWVIDHPEWFLSRADCPYPSYSFNGPDLSHDGRVEIKIDDHYYEQSDAAVVFRRRDKWTGDSRYLYHGNDGTSFPWNDTAQLDYLNPATREQVIQTILHVARLFPIIRFDAAMTLAKKHVERLWYPLPGAGGAIPSRAEFSMSHADFNAAMPNEFWREVVDRVAQEVPGTLLLAEAFWLMEGYFVRTLGMHRVYNSAFMNMLRDEDNAKYRSVIKNTLEFDPDILKRYVNFMSNPDERTAIDQFGRDDKCFGVAALMATLPGLPMFGHGQIEGFTEKYGMEYRRPRYDEQPDRSLVERHEREIAPLLHRRWLFAESENFLLYDFYRPEGVVDENVFAYSNRRGDERALVIYHNRYATTYGTIHHSASYADKAAGQLRRRSLGEAFGLPGEGSTILAFRDAITGLTHLARASNLASGGYSIELQAYATHVFLDWRFLQPEENQRWDRLCDSLNGRGVPHLDRALFSLEMAPVHDSLAVLLNAETLNLAAQFDAAAAAAGGDAAASAEHAVLLQQLKTNGLRFFTEAARAYRKRWPGEAAHGADAEVLSDDLCRLAGCLLQLPQLEHAFSKTWSTEARRVLPSASPCVAANAVWGPALAWCALHTLGEALSPRAAAGSPPAALMAYDRLGLREALARAFDQAGIHGEESWRAAARVRVALLGAENGSGSGGGKKRVAGYPPRMWKDADVRWLVNVHEALVPGELSPAENTGLKTSPQALLKKQNGEKQNAERQNAGESDTKGRPHLIEFFNKELHEDLLWWLQLPRLTQLLLSQADGRQGSTPAPPRVPARQAARPGVVKAGNSGHALKTAIRHIETEVEQGLNQARESGYRTPSLPEPARKGTASSPTASRRIASEPTAHAAEPERKPGASSRDSAADTVQKPSGKSQPQSGPKKSKAKPKPPKK